MKFIGHREHEQLDGPFDVELTGANNNKIKLKSSAAVVISIDYEPDDSVEKVPLDTIMLTDGKEKFSALAIAFAKALGASIGSCLRKNLDPMSRVEVGLEISRAFFQGFCEMAGLIDSPDENGNGKLH